MISIDGSVENSRNSLNLDLSVLLGQSANPLQKVHVETNSGSRVCRITNPHASSTYLFLAVDGNSVVLDSHPCAIVCKLDAPVSRSALAGGLSHERMDATSTIWEEVHVLPPGYSGSIRFETPGLKLSFTPVRLAEDTHRFAIADMLITEIQEAAKHFDRVVLRFSGGVDSTALLLAALEAAHRPLSAFTWICERGSSPRDLASATEICAQLGVEHHSFVMQNDHIFRAIPAQAVAPDIALPMASFHVMQAFYAQIKAQYAGESILVLHGHGGDHLFFDPPHYAAVFDSYTKLGLRAAGRKLVDYCRVTGSNLWRPLAQNAKLAFHSLCDAGGANAVLPGKKRHLNFIESAVFENGYSPMVPHGIQNFAPFTTESMLSIAMNYQTWELFDRRETRVPMKESLRGRFPHCPPLRSDKGHVTAAYQRALALREDNLRQRVVSGHYVQYGLLQSDWVDEQWTLSKAGCGGLDSRLCQAVCFELMAEAIANHKTQM